MKLIGLTLPSTAFSSINRKDLKANPAIAVVDDSALVSVLHVPQAAKIRRASICGRCARECPASRLKELTVDHRDGNHDNNPKDGSNWELLCIYCHENEHAKLLDAQAGGGGEKKSEPGKFNPFADPAEKLKRKKEGG